MITSVTKLKTRQHQISSLALCLPYKPTTMSTRLNFLVTHFLSSTTDVELSPRLGFVLADLKQQGGQLFRDAEPTALQRWSSKIGALIASPQSRTSGFKLAAISLELAPALWTTGAAGGVGTTNSASAKAWFDQAFKLAQVRICSQLDFVLLTVWKARRIGLELN